MYFIHFVNFVQHIPRAPLYGKREVYGNGKGWSCCFVVCTTRIEAPCVSINKMMARCGRKHNSSTRTQHTYSKRTNAEATAFTNSISLYSFLSEEYSAINIRKLCHYGCVMFKMLSALFGFNGYDVVMGYLFQINGRICLVKRMNTKISTEWHEHANSVR